MSIIEIQQVIGDLTVLDVFAVLLPEPAKELVDLERNKDIARNPHNDSYKPKRRSDLEIKCQLRYAYAKAMMKERREHGNEST